MVGAKCNLLIKLASAGTATMLCLGSIMLVSDVVIQPLNLFLSVSVVTNSPLRLIA